MDMYFWEENARYASLTARAKSNGLPAPTGTNTFQSLRACSSLEGALSFTPPELSGNPNHTLYLTELITPKNADRLLFLWACGFVMREETLAVSENTSNYSPRGIQTVKWY